MIEYIIGGVVTLGIGTLAYIYRDKLVVAKDWLVKKLKIDKSKVDMKDVVEIYHIVSDFIEGGDDNTITAEDALVLWTRLAELIDSNTVEEIIEADAS